MLTLPKDLIVWVIIFIFGGFVLYVAIQSRRNGKNDKGDEPKE